MITNLHLELTTKCNISCKTCYRDSVKIVDTDFNDLKKFIDGAHSIKNIMLCGSYGEPTVYPNFKELIRFIKSKKIILEIYTNGVKCSEWWEELSEHLSEEDTIFSL